MAEAHFELKSQNGSILLDGKFIPHKKRTTIRVIVTNFDSSAVAHEVNIAESFLNGLSGLYEVEIFLSSSATDLCVTAAIPMLRAFHKSSARLLAVSMSLGNQHHLDFLNREDCINHVRRLRVHSDSPPQDGSANEILRPLTKLQDLLLCPESGRMATTSHIPPLLSCLANVKFNRTMSRLTIGHVRLEVEANAIFYFLQKNEHVKTVDLSLCSSEAAFASLLTKLVLDNGLCLQKIDINVSAPISSASTEFLTALESAISNLRPCLRKLRLYLDGIVTKEAKELIKQKLLAAFDRNEDNVLALRKFTFKVKKNNDEELSRLCSAFAAKNKITRATAGTLRLPRAALPRAVKAIQNHPPIQPEEYSVMMLYQYIRNDPDLIQNAAQFESATGQGVSSVSSSVSSVVPSLPRTQAVSPLVGAAVEESKQSLLLRTK